MLTRRDIEKEENIVLAPYAARSGNTKGRAHEEKEHPYRSAYQRDKDRIIYSGAFRRLEYKTQVFVNHEGDHYRTRLTHTLEVAQIAKTIARALRLNSELVEAIALAHDLGHTPFGHSGEEVLAELMKDHGGFDHNRQGLRVVDFLEKLYPDFPGLNLTYEVREGIIKHSTRFDKPGTVGAFGSYGMATLETQAVDMADEIAYDNHDLDDGISSGLIEEKALHAIPLWKNTAASLKDLWPKNASEKIKRAHIIRSLINAQVTDVIQATEKRLKKLKIRTCKDARESKNKIVGLSEKMAKNRVPMRDFLMKRLYNHYRVVRMSKKASRIIKDLFEAYSDNPAQLPPAQSGRLRKEDKFTVVSDYIAGMTDRYASDEYGKLFDPYKKV